MKTRAFLLYIILGFSMMLNGCAGSGGAVKDSESQKQVSATDSTEVNQEHKAPKATESKKGGDKEPDCD